jgi:hypothetical protein
VLRSFWEAQVTMGRAMAGDVRPRPPAGPPSGHPERLVHNAALDPEEWALWTDILGREPGGR